MSKNFNPKLNKGFNYILTVIDVFSKYAFAIPIKNKSSDSVIAAFQEIFKERKPTKFIQSDLGKEYDNKKFKTFLKQYNIDWFATKNFDTKAQIVERFNRTLKEKMWRCFTSLNINDTKKAEWYTLLPKLIKNYNNSYHSSIKMTPIEASKPENEFDVYNHLYSSDIPKIKRFKVGDDVRITKVKTVFDKGYLPNYTTEIFTINKVIETAPITYEIKDENNEIIDGKFYNEELTLVKL